MLSPGLRQTPPLSTSDHPLAVLFPPPPAGLSSDPHQGSTQLHTAQQQPQLAEPQFVQQFSQEGERSNNTELGTDKQQHGTHPNHHQWQQHQQQQPQQEMRNKRETEESLSQEEVREVLLAQGCPAPKRLVQGVQYMVSGMIV